MCERERDEICYPIHRSIEKENGRKEKGKRKENEWPAKKLSVRE